MNRCQVKSVKKNNIIEFIFSGSIDESLANYIKIFPSVPTMTINLDGIRSINSAGTREWVSLMRKVEMSKVTLIKCPKIFIDQVNMVKVFLPDYAKIESFYVPYFSEKTNTEKKILFEKGKQFTENSVKYENTITDESGIVYEIDVTVNSFFKFIKA